MAFHTRMVKVYTTFAFCSAAGLWAAGCSGDIATNTQPLGPEVDGGTSDGSVTPELDGHVSSDGGGVTPDGRAGDAALPIDGGSALGAIAPAGTVPGELPSAATQRIDLAANGKVTYRVTVEPGEHVAFKLNFPTSATGVKLAALRYVDGEVVQLAMTDGGAGFRVLAVMDQQSRRTFWAQVSAGSTGIAAGSLEVTRTPFQDGLRCTADCTRFLQLPIPNNPAVDGYLLDDPIFRYQFGRRDIIMLIRDAGKRMAAAGRAPFVPEDISQWDGKTPGTDTGAKRHASHDNGKDVDISLYGSDGSAPWRSYCTVAYNSGGRECTSGSRKSLFDPMPNIQMIGAFFASGRVTMSFLDKELIAGLRPMVSSALSAGMITSAVAPYFSDGTHLQHWPNHDNHVHIRLSVAAYPQTTSTAAGSNADTFTALPVEVFQAP